MTTPNRKLFYILIIFITFFLVSFLAITFKPNFPIGDGAIYNKIAKEITDNHTFPIIEGQIHKPGYPFLLASVYFLFGEHNYTALFIIQFLMLLGTSLIILKIGKKHFKFTYFQATLPAILILIWPYFILYATLLLTEVLYTFLLMVSFYFFLETLKKINKKNIFSLSFFLALTTLVRPIPMLLPFWLIPIIFLVVYFKKNYSIKKFLINSVLISIIFFMLLSPWIIYASKKTGKFTPIASNGAVAFNIANKNFSKEYKIYKTPGYEKGGAWTWEKFIKSKLRNVYRFWKSGAEGYHVDSLVKKFPPAKYLILLYRIGFYIIVALGLSSVYFINKKKEIFLLWLIISYIWAVHIALFPYPRLTLPIIPIMFVLALYSAIQYWNIYQKKIQKTT